MVGEAVERAIVNRSKNTAKRTPAQRVRDVYPSAFSFRAIRGGQVDAEYWIASGDFGSIIGHASTRRGAWQDAALKLK